MVKVHRGKPIPGSLQVPKRELPKHLSETPVTTLQDIFCIASHKLNPVTNYLVETPVLCPCINQTAYLTSETHKYPVLKRPSAAINLQDNIYMFLERN
jgi:hypothetical protein